MAAGRTSPKDQPPDAPASNPKPSRDQAPDATKFTKHTQIVAQIVLSVAGLAGTAIVHPSWHATLIVITIAFLLLFLVQFFANLKLFPKTDLAPLVSKILSIVGWIAALGIGAFAGVQIASLMKRVPGPDPPTTEATLRELSSKLNGLRAEYRRLPGFVTRAADLNRRAAILADNISDLNDANLDLGMQVFKYESLAYANGIVAGSEMIARDDFTGQDKLQSIGALLDASENAQKLIEGVRRPQPVDANLQQLRSWLRDDDADPRLQRLTAVGLCFRWQVKKNPKDRIEARDLVNTLPAYYRAREHPEQSSELADCVKGN
ncbi:MAG: hypothetical protein ACJ71U_16275 [Terriglobales bacterium]